MAPVGDDGASLESETSESETSDIAASAPATSCPPASASGTSTMNGSQLASPTRVTKNNQLHHSRSVCFASMVPRYRAPPAPVAALGLNASPLRVNRRY